MTNKKALDILKTLYPFCEGIVYETVRYAYKNAYVALEKQIPKEPKKVKTEGEDHISGYCPICYRKQHYFPNNRGLYCDNCGQKLKWGDYE